jgi:hypothetical protein
MTIGFWNLSSPKLYVGRGVVAVAAPECRLLDLKRNSSHTLKLDVKKMGGLAVIGTKDEIRKTFEKYGDWMITSPGATSAKYKALVVVSRGTYPVQLGSPGTVRVFSPVGDALVHVVSGLTDIFVPSGDGVVGTLLDTVMSAGKVREIARTISKSKDKAEKGVYQVLINLTDPKVKEGIAFARNRDTNAFGLPVSELWHQGVQKALAQL